MESKEHFKVFKLIEILIRDTLVGITQFALGTTLSDLFPRKVIQRQGYILVPRNVQTVYGARSGFY